MDTIYMFRMEVDGKIMTLTKSHVNYERLKNYLNLEMQLNNYSSWKILKEWRIR